MGARIEGCMKHYWRNNHFYYYPFLVITPLRQEKKTGAVHQEVPTRNRRKEKVPVSRPRARGM